MKEFIPLLSQDNIPYVREEKSGFFTILLKGRPEKNVQLVNATAKFIMDSCNGVNSIEDIVAQLEQKYPEASKSAIHEDVLKALQVLDDLGLLSWKGENPFKQSTGKGSKETRVYRAEEGDFGQLCELIEGLGVCDLPLESNGNIFYINPFVVTRLYDTNILRPRFFNHQEDFFILTECDRPSGFLSIMNSRPSARIAQISLVALTIPHEAHDVEKIISSAVGIIADRSMLTKLKWVIPSEDFPLTDLAERSGFKKEATLYHEIDEDKHVDIFSRFFVSK